MSFSEEKLREVRESVDLVALISEYVPLRRQGARYVGLCPFHQEKTPSFGVSRGKDFFYCFGCQASGDAISFLRHVEGIGFSEAVQKLADRAGIELPRSDDEGQVALARARARRERLSELMLLAQTFYEEQLERHPHAELARAELARRKVRPEIAALFHLGYAPSGWDGLARYLESKRVALEEAVEVGLIAPRNQGGGYYDRFRHRLMFPVADQHGRIIAFSGRALTPPEGSAEREAPAKYINSPEGPLYKKGQALFGLSTGRIAMRKHGRALLCEGNFDLVAIYQAGFENVLAPLGTAFTLDQARLLRRFVEEVVVIFDGDNAGRKATAHAHELLATAGLRGRAVRLPDGHDPDSFLAERGAETLATMVEKAPPILDFLIDEASLHVDDASSRVRAIHRLAPFLSTLSSPERSHYEQQIARKFLLKSDGMLLTQHIADVRTELRRALTQGGDLTNKGRGERLTSKPQTGSSLAETRRPREEAVRVRPTKELPERQRLVLGALLDQPELFRKTEAQRLVTLLTDSDLRAIFLVAQQIFVEQGELGEAVLLAALQGNPATGWLVERRLSGIPALNLDAAEQVLIEGLFRLERDLKNEQRERLRREYNAALSSGDEARARELMRLRDELASSENRAKR